MPKILFHSFTNIFCILTVAHRPHNFPPSHSNHVRNLEVWVLLILGGSCVICPFPIRKLYTNKFLQSETDRGAFVRSPLLFATLSICPRLKLSCLHIRGCSFAIMVSLIIKVYLMAICKALQFIVKKF